jgi:hypothetical protein
MKDAHRILIENFKGKKQLGDILVHIGGKITLSYILRNWMIESELDSFVSQ